jgi:hypothetical protein
MSDQLHDLLTRIADQAGAGPNDPTLWDRARRARRDRRRRRVAAAGALVLAVLAVLAVAGLGGQRVAEPPPVEQPDRRDGPGIPATIHGVPGTGGLALERDLGVGPAAVALSTPAGAFLVTAKDGAYHRVRLAGFHPELHSAALAGLALSPDGRRLAWTWQGSPGPDGSDYGWGLRVADLTTGDVRTTRVDVSSEPGVLSNPRWSPDGQYVIMDEVFGVGLVDGDWVPPADADYAIEYVGAVLDVRQMRLTSIVGSYLDGSPYDAWVVAPTRRAYRVVGDRLLTWTHTRGEAWHRTTLATGVSGASTGRVSGDGRWLLLSGRDGSTGVALVDLHAPGPEAPVTRIGTRAEIDVIGWTDDRHVLALEGRGEGARDLIRLAIEPAPAYLASGSTGPVRLETEQLGSLVGAGPETAVSVAVDLAAGERTVWDADAPPFVPQAPEARDPTRAPSSPAPSSPAPAASSSGGGRGGTGTLLLAGVGALVVTTAVLGAAWAGRRRRAAR